MVLHNPAGTVALIQNIAENLRRRPTLTPPPASPLGGPVQSFCRSTADFAVFLQSARAVEPETAAIVERLQEMATALNTAKDAETLAGLVSALLARPTSNLCAKSGAFLSYRKKTKWTDAAKKAGLSKTDGERLSAIAQDHYQNCCDAWNALKESAASQILEALIAEARTILDRYRDHKRAAALLILTILFSPRGSSAPPRRRAASARPALPACPRRRIPGYRSASDRNLLAALRRTCRRGPPSPLDPIPDPERRALPRRRSQAGHLPFPRRRCQHLRAGARNLPRPTRGQSVIDFHEFPILRLDPVLRQPTVRGRSLRQRPTWIYGS